MNRGTRALFERNADACESAKWPTCKCACGGALHGSRHSFQWRKETWGAIAERREQERRELEESDDLFHAAGGDA
jgi:hypothetical protein